MVEWSVVAYKDFCPHTLVLHCAWSLPQPVLCFFFSPPLLRSCPVPHTALLWMLNTALSHGGQGRGEEGREGKEKEREKKQHKTDRGGERRSEGRDVNRKGKLTARRWGTCRQTARLRNKNVRDKSRKSKRRILNHHRRGKHCFEIGHATMQRLLAPNSFCRTLQKCERLCVRVCACVCVRVCVCVLPSASLCLL